MPKKYKEGIYMGVAPTTHMHATNITLNDGTSVQADSDSIHDYLNRKFELIEDITLTEDTAVIERTTEPDTTPYNFSNIVIFITTEAAAANAALTFDIYSGSINFHGSRANAISTTKQYSTIKAYNFYNSHDITFIGPTNSSNTILSPWKCNRQIMLSQNFTKINLTCTDNIPSGSNIKIYAVRT